MTATAKSATGQGFDDLAVWAVARGREPIAEPLLDVVRARLLDYVGNVAGGSGRPAVRMLSANAAAGDGCVPLPGGARAPIVTAALPWGAAAHVLEYDDTHQASSSHPGAVVFTAALQLAAREGLSLEAAARAAIVGYEVMCRLGTASGPANEYDRGFHPTGTCGVFGAAAAAAVLLELDVDALLSALGIAASLSSGSMAFLTNGAWTKILHPGNAARNGVLAAELAAGGYKGPVDPLSPPHGYFAGHAAAGATPSLTAPGPEDALAIERTSIKAHGCCRYEQGPIDGLLALRSRLAFAASDVAAVDVAVLRGGWSIIAEPLEAKRRPRSTVEAQFSMPFGAALALVRGSASPFDHDEASLDDPALLAMADLVTCRLDEEIDAEYPAKWPAIVDVRLRDGSVHRERVDYPRGDPENPHTLDELAERVGVLVPWAPEEAVAELVDFGDLSIAAADVLERVAACFEP